MSAREVIVKCGCGAGVIVLAGKGGIQTGKCPLCSRECTVADGALEPVSETPTAIPKKKGTEGA